MHHIPPRLLARRLVSPVKSSRPLAFEDHERVYHIARKVREANLQDGAECLTMLMDPPPTTRNPVKPLELSPMERPAQRGPKPAPRVPRDRECHLIEFVLIGAGLVGLIFLVGAALSFPAALAG